MLIFICEYNISVVYKDMIFCGVHSFPYILYLGKKINEPTHFIKLEDLYFLVITFLQEIYNLERKSPLVAIKMLDP